jgi:hypothetical protein
MEALITHESAHAMFHTLGKGSDSWKGFNNQKQPTGKILKEAWKKAAAQAVADGIIKPQKTGFSRILDSSPEFKLAKFISRYADTSVFREESEAEIFRAYHWSSNPSKFIDAFMKELNDGLGVDAPPFSGRKIK